MKIGIAGAGAGKTTAMADTIIQFCSEIEEHKKIFEKRFSRYMENEYVCRQECKQLVLGDIENNFPVKNTEDPIQEKINYWRSVL